MCKDRLEHYTYNPSSTLWIGGDLNLPDINWSLNAITGHQYPLSFNDHFLAFYFWDKADLDTIRNDIKEFSSTFVSGYLVDSDINEL